MLRRDCTIDQLNAYLRTHASPSKVMPVFVKEAGDCWEWQGSVNHMGYGSFRSQRVNVYVAQACGIAGPDERVQQWCHNRRCIKPGHLYVPRETDPNLAQEDRYLNDIVTHTVSELARFRDPRNQIAISNGMAYWEDEAGNRVTTIE
jgi:hypothetical protein